MSGVFLLGRNHHCFRAMFRAFMALPLPTWELVLSNDFPCLHCLFFTWAFRDGWGGSLALWLFVTIDRWILICMATSQFIKLSVWILAEMGSQVLNALCFGSDCIFEFHPITNTLKMGLLTPLANHTAQNFSVCVFQLTHVVDWSLKSWTGQKPVCATKCYCESIVAHLLSSILYLCSSLY